MSKLVAHIKSASKVYAVVILLAVTSVVSWHVGANYGDAKMREKVAQKAQTCHALRNMGFKAFAMSMSMNSLYFPSQECKVFYDLIGQTEPALVPQAKKLEDETLAKYTAHEAEIKKQSDAGTIKWK